MEVPERSRGAKNDSAIRKVSEILESRRAELSARVSELFRSLAWENRYLLHPRRLSRMPDEEVESLLSYLRTGDPAPAAAHGGARAAEGLTHNAVLGLSGTYTRFLRESAAKGSTGIPGPAAQALDSYICAYLKGFIEKRESHILSDQEQLRVALSAALDRQRRELHIKNYAIHTSINGILIAGMNGRITYANPAFARLWGLAAPDTVLNTPMPQLWGPEKAAEIEGSLEADGGWQGEVTCRREDGSSIDVAVSASLIMDETKTPIGVMASLIDVTLRHRLESQFRQAQKMEALGQLAGGIVHDFNNLLTAISGYAQLELMDLKSDTPQYNDFLQIKTATDRGMELTKELRIFTRQETMGMEPISANEVIDETYNIMKHLFRPDVKIELDLAKSLEPVRANRSQLIQLIMNLCVNADDAILSGRKDGVSGDTSNAGGTIAIRTANVDLNERDATKFLNAKPGRYVCLTVSDTGCGMDAATMERLFEPFFTTKGEKRGTGLGLAVVYGIVQNHHGFLDVESRPGAGSTFRIYIPALKDRGEARKPLRYAAELTSGRGTILLADDDHQVMDMLSRTLEKSGYQVIPASNGVEALLKYKTHRDLIDLVVLDMVMGQLNGRDCLHHLKQINPEVKVVIITGHTTDGSAEDLLNEGALRVISKPFELRNFTSDVRTVMGR